MRAKYKTKLSLDSSHSLQHKNLSTKSIRSYRAELLSELATNNTNDELCVIQIGGGIQIDLNSRYSYTKNGQLDMPFNSRERSY